MVAQNEEDQKEDPPGAWVVLNEVPSGGEVLAGKVPAHSWKCQLHVFLGDFAPGHKKNYIRKIQNVII